MVGAWPPRPLPVPPLDLSERFSLRPWRSADAAALAAAWSDPEVTRWLDPPGADVSAADAWIAGEADRRASGVALDLVIDIDGLAAGEVGFSSFDPQRRACLVGYWLAAEHRGHGLAAEALEAATAWFLSETECTAVLAECDPKNTDSHRVAERAGFELLSPNHAGHRVYVTRP